MRSLESDVPKTISQVLSTHKFQKRKELIEKVFVPESKFWHLFFQTVNRRELFGVYQMWGMLATESQRCSLLGTHTAELAFNTQVLTTSG